MKKCFTKITGAVFAALLVSFVAISCNNNAEPEPKKEEQKKEDEKNNSEIPQEEVPYDKDGDKIHGLILPHGTEVEIKPWTKAADALDNNLPDFVTCFSDDLIHPNGNTNRTDKLKAAVQKAIDEKSFAGRTPKNVIIVFGDGMGESHLLGSRKYYGDLIMDMLPYHAPVNHDSYYELKDKESLDDTTTTDSSAGGTAIVTGFKTRYGYIGLDANGTPVKNLAELAREKGMLVGNVTNDHMGDATPADVSIHDLNRNYQNQIYGKLFISSPDIAMGSDYGYSNYIQEGVTSKRETIADIYEKLDKETNEKLKTKYKSETEEQIQQRCKDASLKLWYEANATDLQKWAIQMLKVFDNKTINDSVYDFNDWSADRNMHSYGTFKKLMNAVQGDYSIRAVSSYSYGAEYEYSPKKGETAPCYGYKLGYESMVKKLPTYPEMVASTISVLDHKSKANGDCGFFCLIENTCSDGWGHASQPYDCLNEIQCFDEGVAIAIKYVLENPDTLLVITADHETGAITYSTGWENDYTKIKSKDSGHSSKPVPVIAFGAKADLFPERENTEGWTASDWASYVKGDKGKEYTIQNRQTGILIGQAMGFTKFGDLNGNGILDPDTESDSVVTNNLGAIAK